MSFSIFSSKDREAACVACFAATFVLLTAGWELLPRSFSGRFRPLVMQVSKPPASAWYLGNFHGQIEQFVIYDNLAGAAEPLKHADVLFVGDSLILFAFQNQGMLQQFFSARGLRYYFLAFGGEADEVFVERVIRKFDLHPKWVIVDADMFFGLPPSPAASRAMSFGPLEGWKANFEGDTSFAVQRGIHSVFPYFGFSQWDSHPQWIWYRSRSDGVMRLAAWRGMAAAVKEAPESDLPWRELFSEPPKADEIKSAMRFRNELESRGTRLALTWTPPNPGNNAAHLAATLQVALIGADAKGLKTIDGKHLDRESSTRFTSSFLEHFEKILER